MFNILFRVPTLKILNDIIQSDKECTQKCFPPNDRVYFALFACQSLKNNYYATIILCLKNHKNFKRQGKNGNDGLNFYIQKYEL